MDQQNNNSKSNLLKQLVKFAVVGLINTGVDYIVLFALTKATGIYEGNGLIPLNAISFSAAVVNSYFLNKKWSFNDQSNSEGARKFSLFLVVSVIGAAINTGIVVLVSTKINPLLGLSQEQWLAVSKILATGVTLIWNFVGYKLLVFKKS